MRARGRARVQETGRRGQSKDRVCDQGSRSGLRGSFRDQEVEREMK